MNNQTSPFVITKFDRVNVIMEESPRAAELLAEYGIHCVGCYFSEDDTLETGGQMHGMTGDEVDEMIEEINGQLEKEWRESRHSERNEVKPKNLIPPTSKRKSVV